MKFVDELPCKKSNGVLGAKWDGIAEALRRSAGWGVLAEGLNRERANVAQIVAKRALAQRGVFEVRLRDGTVYARYVGDHLTGAKP